MPSARPRDNRRVVACLGASALAVAAPALAHAQSASSSLSQFHSGYGGSGISNFEGPVDVSTRDANGNLVVTDGVITSSGAGSVFASSGVGGSSSGAGATVGAASAIGNNLSVNVSGNYNTVVVNASQVNNGDVSATTVLNGKVNLDGGQ